MICRTIIVLAAVLVVLVLILPIQYTETIDGCLNCYVHYFRSLSCAVVGLGFGVWNYGLTDCRGPVVP